MDMKRADPIKLKTAKILRKQQTPAEKILWDRLRGKKFLGIKFRRQHILKDYVVDFYCHKLNLVIELDGEIHKNQEHADQFRQSEITFKTGVSFLRFTNEEIMHHLEDALKKIEEFKCNHET